MKDKFGFLVFCVALATVAISMASCLSVQMPDFARPRPVVLAIAGIPPQHNGREIRVGLLAAGTDLSNFRERDFQFATATSEPARVSGNLTTFQMLDADGEPFTLTGAYVIGILISGQIISGIGPFVPMWGGVTITMDILGGTQTIDFADLMGMGWQ